MTAFCIKYAVWIDYIIPVILTIILFSLLFISILIEKIRQKRIISFFSKHGYKRKLFDVPSVGNGAFYGWVREDDNKRIDDRDLKGLKFKTIKERYK